MARDRLSETNRMLRRLRADSNLLRSQNAGLETEINTLIKTNNELLRILKVVETDIEWRAASPTLRMIRQAIAGVVGKCEHEFNGPFGSYGAHCRKCGIPRAEAS